LVVCSLPIAKTNLGAALRRWAAFCFIAAFAPGFFFGIAQEVAPNRFRSHPLLEFIASIAALIVISLAAYILLSLRRRREHPPQQRLAMKQPFTPRRQEDDLFGFLRDQLERDHVERDDG
jgi:hypothetical protein